MRRLSSATRLALTSSTIAIAAGFTTEASAKEAPTTTATSAQTTVTLQDVQSVPTNSSNPADIIQANNPQGVSRAEGPGITVTGSRIRRPNLESVVPVTSVQGEQFFRQGQTSVGDALNDLPQLRSTFAQQNPGLGIGIAGLNLLDLRGLGPKRTLVLVNGRRHVASDITNNASNPDVNTIPSDLIDRVDIVTGGNSAVYGSDAVAGVVNFILKKDFSGIQLRAQGAEAGAGFGTNYLLSALAGQNFGDGKGNVTVEAEYTHQNRVFGSEIPWLKTVDGFIPVDVDPGGLPHGSDGFPDAIFATDIRQATISYRGLIPITYSANTAACGTGLVPTNGPPSTVGGTPYNCNLIFLDDNSLVTQTGTRYGTGPLGGYLGGNGTTGREGQLLSILPQTSRLNLNLLAHYTVSEAFEPFIEAKWSHQDVAGNNASSFGIQGTFGTFDLRERFRLDNPFLTAAQRTQVANAIIASGCNPSFTALCSSARTTRGLGTAAPTQGIGGPLNASDIAAINAGTYRFVDARLLSDIGIRDELFTRNTYRLVGGFRGTFNKDWSYELSANYGQFDETDHNNGFVDRQRFMLSLDAGRNPASGQIQCRAQYDPNAAVAFTQGLSAADAALAQQRLAADIAACVPYNPFGTSDNTAAAQYFLANNIVKHSRLTQLDFLGYVNGNSAQLFSLPGGPIDFVLGGEYRRETAFYHDDPFVKIEATNNVIIGDFIPPAFHVAEAFGEIHIPILKDMPFFHELTLSGAGRYSRYKSTIGNVWTYNFGGEWAPVRDIRFRGNFGKAVRAPNLSETAFPQVPNFAPNFVDPCTSAVIGNNANRSANCQADLGALLAGLPNVTQSLPVVSGSNPLLKPETSYSLTLGGVLQPRFIPGLSLSADYYDIKVKGVIVSVPAQQIANLCYDQPSLNNVYCGLFTRWRGPGTGPLGEQPGQILGNSLIQAGVNFAKRIRRGVDINANYRARLGSKVVLDAGLIWVHALKSSNYENPALPNFENRILSELGDPQDEGRLDMDLKVGNVTFGYSAHYIAPMYLGNQEDFGTLPGACSNPADPLTCPPNNADRFEPHKFPAISYHAIRFQWDTGSALGMLKNIQIYGGIDNIFDRHAPFNLPPGGAITTDRLTNSQGAIYDARGRNFYGGIKVRY